MGLRCSSAETQVCHRRYIIAASVTSVFEIFFNKLTFPIYNIFSFHTPGLSLSALSKSSIFDY